VGAHLAPAGDGDHARLPGRALAHRREIPPQAGNDHPTGIPTGVFTTADGHINIAASGQTMYRRLCTAIGAAELIDDPRFKNLADRSKNRKQMNAELDRILAKKPSAE